MNLLALRTATTKQSTPVDVVASFCVQMSSGAVDQLHQILAADFRWLGRVVGNGANIGPHLAAHLRNHPMIIDRVRPIGEAIMAALGAAELASCYARPDASHELFLCDVQSQTSSYTLALVVQNRDGRVEIAEVFNSEQLATAMRQCTDSCVATSS